MGFQRQIAKNHYLHDKRVENMFINEYMIDAPGEYVKVFLYGLMYADLGMPLENDMIARELSMEEEELLKIHKPLFEEFGFELEHFGGREYNIRAVPSNLYGVDQKALFLELLGNLDKDNNQTPDILLHKLATAACKAAVKGNQRLSPAEADCLIDELLQLENPYHCPHGRPTIVSMTKTELEKKFRSIV